MPFTTGEITASGLLSMALLGFAGWIRSIATRCKECTDRLTVLEATASKKSCYGKLEERLVVLENKVTAKSSQIDIHENNLIAGGKRMDEMKMQLDSLNRGVADLHLQGQSILGKIEGLGEKFQSGVKEVWLKLDPRIERVEEKIEELGDDRNKK